MTDKTTDVLEYVKQNRRRLDNLEGVVDQQRSDRQIQDTISFGVQNFELVTSTDLIVNDDNGNLINEENFRFELIGTKATRDILIDYLINGGSNTVTDTLTGSGEFLNRREADAMKNGNGFSVDTTITREGNFLQVNSSITLEKGNLSNLSITEVGIGGENALIQYYKVDDIIDRIESELNN